ncbi:P-loop containing nucleoside triphosphate hydrolase protein [Aspergillus coremiiformis]|uniref:P-loop containing nucleoside triphosphate hydrolase protein n=1 Tax=Aspergillus coremiiformis TaxID=138285 RepID=A0A5N6Z5M3_9EURO|nr:P-loop containing nucleoside triphosphate hydrolase protein [Aspergillus coremiiformis]
MAVSCPQREDNAFGPAISCPTAFDFTLVFEQSVLSIGPSALFLLFVPLRIWTLHGKSVKTTTNKALWPKLAVAVPLIGVQIATLVLWVRHNTSPTAVPAGLLSLLDGLFITILSVIEYSRSVRPSSLLSVYLLASIFFESVQARTLFIRHYGSPIAAAITASIGLKLLLLLLEIQSKRRYLKSPHREYPPEELSGVFSRTVFSWLNKLFVKGFRNLLTVEELFPTDSDLKSTPLLERIHVAWKRHQSKNTTSIILATVSCFRWSIIRIVFPRLCLIGFNYAQTFFIQRAIEHLHQPETQKTKNDGYGLIGAAALIYGGIAISTVHYKHQLFRIITMFRGAFIALIYDHSLALHDGAYDESAAVTLMSTDVDMIARSLEQVNEAWARLLEVVIGIWLLERQLGAVCVAPILVILVCTSVQMYMATFMPARQKVWVGAIQRRVGIISTALRSMKSVKMLGWSDHLANLLQEQRKRELDLSKSFRWLIVWLNVIASLPQMSASLATFAAFVIRSQVDQSDHLSTTQAFTSLAIITLITKPALQLLASIPALTAALAAFDRVHKFLDSSAKQNKLPCERSETASRSGSCHDSPDKSLGIQTNMLNSQYPSDQVILTITEARIRPVPDSEFSLQNISLKIQPSTMTAITGPVGCGKSTLLKAIIGELPLEQGHITKTNLSVAYCSQSPWFQNSTIRDNVCGYSAQNTGWYHEVLRACALDNDISQIPDGDQSIVGSRALTLSGGQKQRLSLARAIYSREKLLVLDDVFSGVDSKTEQTILERLFGEEGLCRRIGTTVLMATHSSKCLAMSDQVIVMNAQGSIVENCPFHSLKSKDVLIGGVAEKTRSTSESMDGDSVKPSLTKGVTGRLTADDIADVSRRTGDIAVYRYYLRAIGWRLTIIACAIILAHTFSANFPQVWLDMFTNDNGRRPGRFIGIYVLLAVAASGSQGLMVWQIMINIVVKSGLELHGILVRTVMHAPMRFFAEVDSGVVLNRFSQDMTLVDAVLPTMAFGTLLSAAQCLAQAALISLGASYMAITIVPTLLVLYCAQKIYLRTSRQLRFLDLEAKSPLYTHFVETLEGLSTVRGFGWQHAFVDECLRRLDVSQRPYYLLTCIQRWLSVVLDLLVTVLAVILTALATTLRSSTDPGKLGVSLTAVMVFNQTLQELVDSWTGLETSLGAIARTRSFELKTPSEHQVGENCIPAPDWPSRGAIDIQSVSASYDGTTPVLSNINMQIAAGETVRICGRSGSGKSTLLSVLLRLLDTTAGTISIDGIDIATIPRNVLRSRLIAIPQDPLTLAGTVRFNLDPTGVVPDDAIISALDKVHLLELIESRGGLGTELTSQPLSQGEQNLFALARALVRKWKKDRDSCGNGGILILDEATSNTDAATEKLMQEVIERQFAGYTIINVTHRMGKLRDAETVLEMEHGRFILT